MIWAGPAADETTDRSRGSGRSGRAGVGRTGGGPRGGEALMRTRCFSGNMSVFAFSATNRRRPFFHQISCFVHVLFMFL